MERTIIDLEKKADILTEQLVMQGSAGASGAGGHGLGELKRALASKESQINAMGMEMRKQENTITHLRSANSHLQRKVSLTGGSASPAHENGAIPSPGRPRGRTCSTRFSRPIRKLSTIGI